MLRIFKQYYPIRNIFFILGEGVVIYVSILLAYGMLRLREPFELNNIIYLKAFLITLISQTFLYYNDLYDLKVTDSFMELTIRLFQALGAAAIFFALTCFVFPDATIGRWIFLLSLVLIIFLIASWRFAYNSVLNLGIFNQNIVLLGSGKLARNILEEIKVNRDCGYSVSVLVEDCPTDRHFAELKNSCAICKNDFNELCETAKAMNASKVVVAMTERRGNFPSLELLKCRVDGIEVLDGNTFYEMLSGKLMVEQTNPAWLIFSSGFRRTTLRYFLKRVLDIIMSALFLALVSPLVLLVVLALKLESPKKPVMFSQERIGQRKKPYRMYKFRSMWGEEEKPTWADEERVTRVGKIIRKVRMDEIPQAWNVLKGEMSFVGPRPERGYFIDQLEEIIPYYSERFTVKPGITGWAQVCYGYGASVEDALEKLNYDLFYIKNMSFFMDLMILIRTIKIVLFGKGAR